MQAHGITHILNAADDVENAYESVDNKFCYCNLGLADFGAEKSVESILRKLDAAIEFCQRRDHDDDHHEKFLPIFDFGAVSAGEVTVPTGTKSTTSSDPIAPARWLLRCC